MTVDIELDGTRRQVVLRRAGGQWVAGLDGRELTVSLVEAAGRWSMLVGPEDAASGVSRTSYDIAFERSGNGELIVHVNGCAIPVAVIDRRRRGRRGGETGSSTEPRTIVAPMPGRIVKVLVQPGEAVAARQGLIVVEAMKMENELRAPRSGTIADVRVAEGASVEANAVLLVLK
jgi:biotin carboxyl carrier protein